MVHPHRQHGEGAAAPLQPQEAEEIWLVTKHSQTFTDAQSRASCRAVASYSNCSAHNRKALQRVVGSAQRITEGKLPALQDTYTTRCHRKAKKIRQQPPEPLPVQPAILQRARSVQVHQSGDRLKNSFCLKAIRLLNRHH